MLQGASMASLRVDTQSSLFTHASWASFSWASMDGVKIITCAFDVHFNFRAGLDSGGLSWQCGTCFSCTTKICAGYELKRIVRDWSYEFKSLLFLSESFTLSEKHTSSIYD